MKNFEEVDLYKMLNTLIAINCFVIVINKNFMYKKNVCYFLLICEKYLKSHTFVT